MQQDICKKIPSLTLRMMIALGLDVRLSQPVCDPSLKDLVGLASLKSRDTTKLSVDDNIYMLPLLPCVEYSIGEICWLPHTLKCNSSSQEVSTPGCQ